MFISKAPRYRARSVWRYVPFIGLLVTFFKYNLAIWKHDKALETTVYCGKESQAYNRALSDVTAAIFVSLLFVVPLGLLLNKLF